MIFFDKAVWKKVKQDNGEALSNMLVVAVIIVCAVIWIAPLAIMGHFAMHWGYIAAYGIIAPFVIYFTLLYIAASKELTEAARRALRDAADRGTGSGNTSSWA